MPPLPFDSPDDAWPVIRAIMRLDSRRLRSRCDGSGMAIRGRAGTACTSGQYGRALASVRIWAFWPQGAARTAAVGQNQGVRIGCTAEPVVLQTAKIMVGTAFLNDLREHLTAIVHALE